MCLFCHSVYISWCVHISSFNTNTLRSNSYKVSRGFPKTVSKILIKNINTRLCLVQQEFNSNYLETMTKTLQAALAPLIIFGSFFSLSLFEYPLGHSRPYLSCLYVLATWSFLIYYIYYPFYYIILYNKSFIIRYWKFHVILITTILLIPVSFFYFKVKILYFFIL